MPTSAPAQSLVTPSPRIVVTERSSDFHACIEGNPGRWEAGRTIHGAVGKLRVSFPELATAEIVLILAPYFSCV